MNYGNEIYNNFDAACEIDSFPSLHSQDATGEKKDGE